MSDAPIFEDVLNQPWETSVKAFLIAGLVSIVAGAVTFIMALARLTQGLDAIAYLVYTLGFLGTAAIIIIGTNVILENNND